MCTSLEAQGFEFPNLYTKEFFENDAVCAKTEHRSGAVHSGTVSIGAEGFVRNAHASEIPLTPDTEFFDKVQVSLAITSGNVL